MDTIKLHVNGETYYMTGSNAMDMSKQVRTARGNMAGKGDIEFWLDTEDFAKVRRATRCTISGEAPAAAPAGVRMATEKQIGYLVRLGVQVEKNMTMDRASQLIDAAKGGYLGSVNGFYRDGSN